MIFQVISINRIYQIENLLYIYWIVIRFLYIFCLYLMFLQSLLCLLGLIFQLWKCFSFMWGLIVIVNLSTVFYQWGVWDRFEKKNFLLGQLHNDYFDFLNYNENISKYVLTVYMPSKRGQGSPFARWNLTIRR